MHNLFLFTPKITFYQFYFEHLSFLFVSKPRLKLPSKIYNNIYFRDIKSALMIVTQKCYRNSLHTCHWQFCLDLSIHPPLFYISWGIITWSKLVAKVLPSYNQNVYIKVLDKTFKQLSKHWHSPQSLILSFLKKSIDLKTNMEISWQLWILALSQLHTTNEHELPLNKVWKSLLAICRTKTHHSFTSSN